MKTTKMTIIFLFLIMCVTLTGCSKQSEEELLKQKVDEEINYLDATLISLLNKLNNIYFDNYYVTTEKVKLNDTSQSSSSSGSSKKSEQDSGESGGQDINTSSSEEPTTTISSMKSQAILLVDKSQLHWDSIKTDIENLYSSWNSIIIDLYKVRDKQ